MLVQLARARVATMHAAPRARVAPAKRRARFDCRDLSPQRDRAWYGGASLTWRKCARPSELDPAPRLDARLVGVLDDPHLGDRVGDRDKLGLGGPAGDHHAELAWL